MLVKFSSISDKARLWVYQIDKELNDIEEETLLSETSSFVEKWAAHGSGLKAGVRIVAHRLLIIAADESFTNVSGCSIDSQIGFLKEIQSRLGINLFHRGDIFYFQNDELKSMDLVDFRKSVSNGDLSIETFIFDTTIQHKWQLEDKFLIPVKDSWLMRLIKV